ncbi:DNA-binding response regulator, partial [Microvirga sp. 2TAF3]
MYFLVGDPRTKIPTHTNNSADEGVSSLGLDRDDFRDWLEAASRADFEAVQGFLLGEFQDRLACTETIRRH